MVDDFDELWRDLTLAHTHALPPVAPRVVRVPFADPPRRVWLVELDDGGLGLLVWVAGAWLWQEGDEDDVLAGVPATHFEKAVFAVRARPARRVALEALRLADGGRLLLAELRDDDAGAHVAVEWFRHPEAHAARATLGHDEARADDAATRFCEELLARAGLERLRPGPAGVRFLDAEVLASADPEAWSAELRRLVMGGVVSPSEADGLLPGYGPERAVARVHRARSAGTSPFAEGAARP